MLTISKPLSASQVRTYHEREFASERQNYWSRDQQGHSEWQGKRPTTCKNIANGLYGKEFSRVIMPLSCVKLGIATRLFKANEGHWDKRHPIRGKNCPAFEKSPAQFLHSQKQLIYLSINQWFLKINSL